LRVEIFKQELETTANGVYEFGFKAEEFAHEGISKYEVAEEVEGAYFAKDGDEDDGWVGHSLYVADVRPENMEHLQELDHFQYDACLGLVGRFAVEGPFDVLLDLLPYLLLHPPLLASL
jgi:hypothetical protein